MEKCRKMNKKEANNFLFFFFSILYVFSFFLFLILFFFFLFFIVYVIYNTLIVRVSFSFICISSFFFLSHIRSEIRPTSSQRKRERENDTFPPFTIWFSLNHDNNWNNNNWNEMKKSWRRRKRKDRNEEGKSREHPQFKYDIHIE